VKHGLIVLPQNYDLLQKVLCEGFGISVLELILKFEFHVTMTCWIFTSTTTTAISITSSTAFATKEIQHFTKRMPRFLTHATLAFFMNA
jgi:hypothetical protein